jgi:hypothetical protein
MYSTTDIIIKVIATGVGLVVVFVIIFGALFMDKYEKDGLTVSPHGAQKKRNAKAKRNKI